MIRLLKIIMHLIFGLFVLLTSLMLLVTLAEAGFIYALIFLLFFSVSIVSLLSDQFFVAILFLIPALVTLSIASDINHKDSLPDAPRPAVKIAENYFQECNGNNLYVYKYEDRLAVEPSGIQVVANDASCTGVVK